MVVHVILVPLALALALSMRRVEARVLHAGHDVPVEKQRETLSAALATDRRGLAPSRRGLRL